MGTHCEGYFAIQTFIMPQIEPNIYLDALNQAKSNIVHWINMPTMYPLPDASITSIFFCHWCLLEEEKMLTD